VLAFMIGGWIWWPLGLLTLAFIIGSGRMGCWNHHGMGRWDNKMRRMNEKMERMRSHMDKKFGGFGSDWWGGAPSSGNAAFDEYRRDTLNRLQDEQREFKEFLERPRFAKDRAEFDQFIAQRRDRP